MDKKSGRNLCLRALRVVGALFLGCSLFSGSAAWGTEHFPWELPRFDAYVAECMREWEIPGVAIGIVKDGQVVLAQGYGVRDIDKGGLVDEKTLFPIASVTKSFTAALLGLGVEAGKLTWDDPIIKHLPDFQLYDPWATKELTLRDALCHRSGLPSADELWYQTDLTPDEILHQLRFVKPAWSLRARFTYNNNLYAALGKVAERVFDDSWEHLIGETLFKPLGMSSSFTHCTEDIEHGNMAAGHVLQGDQLTSAKWISVDNCRPAASIFSNVTDLLKWVSFHLAQGAIDHQHILREETVQEMHRPQTVVDDPGWLEFFPHSALATYGLGWVIHVHEGRKIVEHIGNLPGAGSLVAFLPEENLGVVVLTNRGSGALFPRAILYHLLEGNGSRVDWNAFFLTSLHRYQEWMRLEKEAFEESGKLHALPSLPLASYAGEYSNGVYGTLCVELVQGDLQLRSRTFQGTLVPWHLDTFQLLPNQLTSEFSQSWYVRLSASENGRVDRCVIQSVPGSNPIEFKKQ